MDGEADEVRPRRGPGARGHAGRSRARRRRDRPSPTTPTTRSPRPRSTRGRADTVRPAPGAMAKPRMPERRGHAARRQGPRHRRRGLDGDVGTPETSADLFDPTSGTFAPTAHPMTAARAGIRAVLARTAACVIASGGDATADVYDPSADTFTQVPPARHAHVRLHGAAPRRARPPRRRRRGGDRVRALRPGHGEVRPAGALNQGRSMLTAHTLPDGRVIVLGGSSISAGGVHVPLDSIELYDSATDKWTVAPYKLSTGRTWHASALVRDGTVLVMGGYNVDGTCTPTNTVDQVDPGERHRATLRHAPSPEHGVDGGHPAGWLGARGRRRRLRDAHGASVARLPAWEADRAIAVTSESPTRPALAGFSPGWYRLWT